MDTFKHKEYLTKKQLAEKLGVTEVSIDNWRRNGSLPYIKMGAQTNSRVLFDWDDVCNMMERRKFNVGERAHLSGLHRSQGSYKPQTEEDPADNSYVPDQDYDMPPEIY